MQYTSPLSPLSPHARCDRCCGVTIVQPIAPSRPGDEHWTLRCRSCGHIQDMQIETGHSQSEPVVWFGRNLH